ncbi:MAG: hypothetical protein QNK03_18575 [Myxococcota bacterium]|nr:hypothetical protein [Myxococcota bacterium]
MVSPAAMLGGSALTLTSGGSVTLTVTDAELCPPSPLQTIV